MEVSPPKTWTTNLDELRGDLVDVQRQRQLDQRHERHDREVHHADGEQERGPPPQKPPLQAYTVYGRRNTDYTGLFSRFFLGSKL